MCCSPNSFAVRAATHYLTRAWQTLIYGKECFILLLYSLTLSNMYLRYLLYVLHGLDNNWVRCTINRSYSTPCKKAEFEHLQIFPGHCLDFFLSVSGKICHSPIKKVKRQPTLIISFSQHLPFFGEQSKNPG